MKTPLLSFAIMIVAVSFCGCEKKNQTDTSTKSESVNPVAVAPITDAKSEGTSQPKSAQKASIVKELSAKNGEQKLTVKAADFKGDVGKFEGNIWIMPSNGRISAENFWCPDGVTEVEFVARGSQAVGVWPQVKVRLVNTKMSKIFDVVAKADIDSAELKAFRFKLPEAYPAGNYNADVFFLNNSDGISSGSKEDRNVYVQSITLNPKGAPVVLRESSESVSSKPGEITRLGKSLKCGPGTGNIDGISMKMASSGNALAHDLYVSKPVSSFTMDAHGSSAAGVWPKVKVRLVETKTSSLVTVFDALDVDSATTKTFTKMFNPPLDAGNYNLEMLYINNSEGIPNGSKEDRNVWIDRVSIAQKL